MMLLCLHVVVKSAFCLPQEPHRVYPSISADQRRPIKVLSLFDGIATGWFLFQHFIVFSTEC